MFRYRREKEEGEGSMDESLTNIHIYMSHIYESYMYLLEKKMF